MTPLLHALQVLAIYVVPFLVLGYLVKRWVKPRDVDLARYRAEQGRNRRARDVFLLGVWRKEDP